MPIANEILSKVYGVDRTLGHEFKSVVDKTLDTFRHQATLMREGEIVRGSGVLRTEVKVNLPEIEDDIPLDVQGTVVDIFCKERKKRIIDFDTHKEPIVGLHDLEGNAIQGVVLIPNGPAVRM